MSEMFISEYIKKENEEQLTGVENEDLRRWRESFANMEGQRIPEGLGEGGSSSDSDTGEGQGSSGTDTADEEDDEEVVLKYHVPDVQLDGNWAVVVCHGDQKSMRPGPKIMLQIIPPASLPDDLLNSEENEARDDSEDDLDVETGDEDNQASQSGAILTPNEAAEAREVSEEDVSFETVDEGKPESQSEVTFTPNEGHGSGSLEPSEVRGEDAMLRIIKASHRSEIESSLNSSGEMPGFEDAEGAETVLGEKFSSRLPQVKEEGQQSECEIKDPVEAPAATPPSNIAKLEEYMIGNVDIKVPVDVVDVGPKPDEPTKKRRSVRRKVPKRGKPKKARRSIRNIKIEGYETLSGSAIGDGRVTRSQSAQRQKTKASLSSSSITLARTGKSSNIAGKSRKGSQISAGLSRLKKIVKRKKLTTKTKAYSQLLNHPTKLDPSGRLICPLCSSTFGNVQTLQVHFVTHTGERPHKCPYCSVWFTQSGTRNRHVLAKHEMGERPHQCPKCTRRFSQVGNMRTHLQAHAKGKLHECSKCFEAYTPGLLERHINIDHS